jgi:hemoglobin
MNLLDTQIYSVIGDEGFARLVSAFYRRVATDEILLPMYPEDDLDGAEWRLREFLIQRFGGPTRYTDQRGHPRLRARHAPFAIDQRARDRWIALMDAALEETGLPIEVVGILQPFLRQTATFMINRE